MRAPPPHTHNKRTPRATRKRERGDRSNRNKPFPMAGRAPGMGELHAAWRFAYSLRPQDRAPNGRPLTLEPPPFQIPANHANAKHRRHPPSATVQQAATPRATTPRAQSFASNASSSAETWDDVPSLKRSSSSHGHLPSLPLPATESASYHAAGGNLAVWLMSGTPRKGTPRKGADESRLVPKP